MEQGSSSPGADLHSTFGEIDIYLFDQLLRGRFDRRRCVLDAGCGEGRNLVYLLRRGYRCFGIDRDPAAIERARALAATIAPELPVQNFCAGEIDRLPWGDASMDAVVCSAVLHFASDVAQFDLMLDEMWRVLAPAGMFFARLASNIGIESLVVNQVKIPSIRFCVIFEAHADPSASSQHFSVKKEVSIPILVIRGGDIETFKASPSLVNQREV